MTKRGDRATISSNTSTLEKDSAFNIANLIMFQKIANILSIVSFVMVTSVIGGGYFGYKYVTSNQFQTKMMNKVLKNVQGLMPSMLNQRIPNTTGESIPLPLK